MFDVGDVVVDQRNGLRAVVAAVEGDILDVVYLGDWQEYSGSASADRFEKEQQHDMAKCPNCEKCIADLLADNAKFRAQNAAFISAAQKQDLREHALMMDRRELAEAVVRGCSGLGTCRWCHTHGGHPHDPSCPVALAERVLAEPVTQLCPTTADNAPDVAQDGAHG